MCICLVDVYMCVCVYTVLGQVCMTVHVVFVWVRKAMSSLSDSVWACLGAEWRGADLHFTCVWECVRVCVSVCAWIRVVLHICPSECWTERERGRERERERENMSVHVGLPLLTANSSTYSVSLIKRALWKQSICLKKACRWNRIVRLLGEREYDLMHYSTCQKVFFQFILRNFGRVRATFVVRAASGAKCCWGMEGKGEKEEGSRGWGKTDRHYVLKVAPGKVFTGKKCTQF